MTDPSSRRKLAAILSADVVGYSSLMAANEAATVETLKAYRDIIARLVVRHGGRVVNAPGDALLAEFPSAVEAVQAAIEIQKSVEAHNIELEADRRMQFRIGVNLGDVIEETDGTIYGDGVNIAARMEALAEGGGVCISSIVYDAVEGKLSYGFDFLGEQQVKNIAKPVRVYRVRSEAKPISQRSASGPSLPDKPSIAVLPFVNMSGDHAHDYLSDGITENIITALSRFRDLSVIASYSAFSYKGKALRIQDVASELGVRFVLEGSVQKSSTRVTITAQLIDGLTGAHLWAERFDRGVEDIATVLDDLTEIIVAGLATTYGGRLGKAWRGRAERTSPQNFQAYDYFQRGVDAFNLFTKGCTATAIQWFEKAIERDPSYGKPYAKIAWAHLVDVWLGWSEDTSFSMAEALKFATAAIQHDDDEAWGYWAMAGYHMFGGHHDRAISAYQRALELNPNDADVLNDFGQCLSFAGRATEGVEVVHKAMRLNPHYPDYWVMQLGPIYFDARRYEDAISTLEKLHSKDTIGVQLYLAASHAALGHTDQARATMASVIRLDPLATLERLAPTFLAPYQNASDRDHLRENLVKAGLPECSPRTTP
ncbi:MAG: adenylate/guanylate cyclase domain-containing protein [Methyloceanibacter sp.]